MKDELGGQIKDVKDDLQEVKGDIKDLIRRQTKLELYDLAQVEKLLMDCGKNKWEVYKLEVIAFSFALL